MSYENFLHQVSKPSRYISVEKNAIVKPHSSVDVSVLLCFPEVYELGMSHLGLRILYNILNRLDFVAAERCFAPWMDMEEKLREFRQSLLSMETQTPLRDFDFVGFSLQSELTFTNLLNVLELSHIPLLAGDRQESDPIVLAGGPVTSNPEPCADFIDAFLIGDGEEALVELVQYYRLAKQRGMSRERILIGIANIPGFYVPRFYEERFSEDGRYLGVFANTDEVPKKVIRRFVAELDPSFYPEKPVIPQTAAVQDRLVVEVVRGCTQGCRFCQAGYIYRPIRELSIPDIKDLTEKGLRETGYDEVGLVSLSTADYSDVSAMVQSVSEITTARNAAISLPSLRADSFSVDLADSVKQMKQTGFTFAPEAGSQRLRRVINKNISNDQLLEAVRQAFVKGWTTLKFYFMVGLPTETYADLDETIDLIRTIEKISREYPGRKKINVSFGPFVPKAHTPFQWDGFMPCAEIHARQQYVRKAVSSKTVHFKWQEAELSHFETVVSKGDRSVAKGLLAAYRAGSRFEGWQENFNYSVVMGAFLQAGLDVEKLSGPTPVDAALPWDHIDSSIKKKFLMFERKKAFREENQTTTDCRFGDCHYCGIPTPISDTRLKNEKPSELEMAARRQSRTETARSSKAFEQTRAESLRYRLFYAKTGKARYLAHSDMIRVLQMAMTAKELPLTWSQGFTPRPVMQFGPVLPLGVESLAELLDIWTYQPLQQSHIDALNQGLPSGVEIRDWMRVDLGDPGLSVLFPYAVYSLEPGRDFLRVEEKVREFSSADTWPVEHRDRVIDLKKAVRCLEVVERKVMMELNVSAQDGQNANPILVAEKILGIARDATAGLAPTKVLAIESR